jgi:BirA family biotin operon repressor/biotin-[acetyl-CoA-carboxylase] ligase
LKVDLVPATVETRWLGNTFDAHDAIDSTNRRAHDLAAAAAEHGTVVVAARQTAGRGRQGRTWNGTDGDLLASCLLRPARIGPDLAALSLVVGLEIAATLRDDFRADRVGVKWPNDVHVGTRKIAGILLEARSDTEPHVVIGFGVNLRRPPQGRGELQGRATSLEECRPSGPPSTPADFLEHLLPRLERGIDDFLEEGFVRRGAEWDALDVLRGRTVEYDRQGRTLRAEAAGVAPDGSLRVVHDDGRVEQLYGGEVHVTGYGA